MTNLTGVRLFNRYDAEGIDEATYRAARSGVFSEPQCDLCYDEELPALPEGSTVLAVESLPGQYDQRADSCAQCIQMITCGERPLIRTARIYVLSGSLTAEDLVAIKGDLINPVESREASLDKPETLSLSLIHIFVGQCVYFHLQIVYGKRGGNGFGCA